MSKVVFTVGTPLRGDKAAGIALAKLMTNNPIEGWDVVDGGASPQSDIASVRRLSPEFLLLVDAADMGLRPGDIRFLSDEEVVSEYLVTNQTLPIVYLLDQLSAICPQLYYLGIQPATTDHFSSLSSPVRAAVDTIYRMLSEKGNLSAAFSVVPDFDDHYLNYTSFATEHTVRAS